MLILALDTATASCSAALVRDGAVLTRRHEPMVRGHQERLATMIDEMTREAGVAFTALDRIGVTVGPGSFTGLRVGLAFAKGLGVALNIPVAGIGTLEAIAASAEPTRLTVAVIDARRDQIYAQAFRQGAPEAPAAIAVEDMARDLIELDAEGPALLIGPGAELLRDAFPSARIDMRNGADPVALARLAVAQNPVCAPAPLYLRTADAKLPAGALT